MPTWTARSMPDLTGRTALITGASSGIGTEAADALAGHGAVVLLAVRDPDKGRATRDAILARYPGASVAIEPLDLADLGSIRACAARLADKGAPIDLLLNNAGLGLQKQRAITVDGFERQFGTNHLGHFALTGLLLPLLTAAPLARVVTISSIAHRRGRIAFDDLQSERRYNASATYAQSKLANLMFALTLDRKVRAAGLDLRSLAAHPGLATTGFFAATGIAPALVKPVTAVIGLFGQDAERGARPGLYAATMPDATGGSYWGPDGRWEVKGDPAPAAVSAPANDRAAQDRLWSLSERLTGVEYGLPG